MLLFYFCHLCLYLIFIIFFPTHILVKRYVMFYCLFGWLLGWMDVITLSWIWTFQSSIYLFMCNCFHALRPESESTICFHQPKDDFFYWNSKSDSQSFFVSSSKDYMRIEIFSILALFKQGNILDVYCKVLNIK